MTSEWRRRNTWARISIFTGNGRMIGLRIYHEHNKGLAHRRCSRCVSTVGLGGNDGIPSEELLGDLASNIHGRCVEAMRR